MIKKYIEFIKEGKTDKFKSKKTYKKGDTVETKYGTYYVNGMPKDLDDLWKKSNSIETQEWEFGKRNIKIVNSKYFTEYSDVAAESRSWFDDKKQPTENQVRNAMIWSYDGYGDYQIKSGGGTKSDSIYISHFKTTIADQKTGNDKDVVILKKFSTVFSDVLIYIDEIQELQDLTESQEVRNIRRSDHLGGVVSVLIRHEAGWPTADGGKKKKMAPQEWIDDLYKELLDEYDKEEINEYLDKIIEMLQKEMETPISKYDKDKDEFVPVDMKDKDISNDERKLKAIQKIKLKI